MSTCCMYHFRVVVVVGGVGWGGMQRNCDVNYHSSICTGGNRCKRSVRFMHLCLVVGRFLQLLCIVDLDL